MDSAPFNYVKKSCTQLLLKMLLEAYKGLFPDNPSSLKYEAVYNFIFLIALYALKYVGQSF